MSLHAFATRLSHWLANDRCGRLYCFSFAARQSAPKTESSHPIKPIVGRSSPGPRPCTAGRNRDRQDPLKKWGMNTEDTKMRKSTFSTAVASPGQAKDAVGEHVARADLSAFQNAKVPLPQAIAAGIQHVGGGKGMDVSFEAKGGTPAYRTKVYYNNTVWEGLVDANTGKVIGQGTTIPEAQLDQEDKAELAA
jgi:uncharacterized membrane protein YkoI